MTRGASAAAANKHLREELALAREARTNLERRVEEAEKRAAKVEAWKAEAMEKGMPEVLAERKRADDAIARAQVAVQEETDRWVEFSAKGWPMLKRIIDNLPDDTAYIEPEGLQALTQIFGSEFADMIGVDRQTRRTMRRPKYGKTRLKEGIEMDSVD